MNSQHEHISKVIHAQWLAAKLQDVMKACLYIPVKGVYTVVSWFTYERMRAGIQLGSKPWAANGHFDGDPGNGMFT